MMMFCKGIISRLVIVFGVALLLNACSPPMPAIDLEPQLNKLFSSLQANDIDTALTFYSDEFFEGIPEDQWRQRLQEFNAYMGPMTSFRIRNQQADTRFSGKFFVFELESVHEGGKKAGHIITYILPVNGDGVKLVAHKITAKGFH